MKGPRALLLIMLLGFTLASPKGVHAEETVTGPSANICLLGICFNPDQFAGFWYGFAAASILFFVISLIAEKLEIGLGMIQLVVLIAAVAAIIVILAIIVIPNLRESVFNLIYNLVKGKPAETVETVSSLILLPALWRVKSWKF